MSTTNAVETEFVLWGYPGEGLPHPVPIALTGGNLRHCRSEQRSRIAEGWQTAIYAKGAAPTGLRQVVADEAGVSVEVALAGLGLTP